MNINSRAKGKRGEYGARDLFRKWGFQAERGGPPLAHGEKIPDLVHSIPGYHVEVKNDERLSIWAMIAQAERDCPAPSVDWSITTTPIVFFKRNGTKFYAAVDADTMLRLLRLEATYAEFKEINDAKPE